MSEMEQQKLKISEDLLNFSYYFFVKNKYFDEYNDEYSKLRIAANRTYYGFYRFLSIEYFNIIDGSGSSKHDALLKAIRDNNLLNLFKFLKEAREWADYQITDPKAETINGFRNIQNRVYRIVQGYKKRNI